MNQITTMGRAKRLIVSVAAVAGIALLATGCTVAAPESNGSSGAAATVVVAHEGELCSLNPNDASCYVLVNRDLHQLTGAYFARPDAQGNLVHDESFGTVEVLSEDPLSITYTVNEGVTWSDGVQVGAADMVLEILARTGYFDDANADKTAGTKYFTHGRPGLGMALADFPEVGDDGRSMTITYATPYADWALVEPVVLPAHIVAAKSGVVADGEALLALLEAQPRGDASAPQAPNPDLVAVGDIWNTGWDHTSMPSDADFLVAAGAYVIEAWETGQSVTFVRNEAYTGANTPEFERVVIRFIADSTAQVQALQNGEVDIIEPIATADTLSALDAVSGATVLTGQSSNYDMLQFNFTSESLADAAVREAFMMVVPREQLTEALVRPLNADAETLNSFTIMPGTDGYDATIAANGSKQFAEADIEGARELLDGRTPTIRFGYNKDNANRLDSFLAIQANAEAAGFVIQDGGLPADQWVAAVRQPATWDVFMWGAAFDAPGVTQTTLQVSTPSGGLNFGAWANAEASTLAAELQRTPDMERQLEIKSELDALLWADGWGLPMFAHTGVQAHSNRVTGLEFHPTTQGIFDAFWKWTPAV